MPWMETNKTELRKEFVFLASKPGANKRELMRGFRISPPTGYKWLERYGKEGLAGLEAHGNLAGINLLKMGLLPSS